MLVVYQSMMINHTDLHPKFFEKNSTDHVISVSNPRRHTWLISSIISALDSAGCRRCVYFNILSHVCGLGHTLAPVRRMKHDDYCSWCLWLAPCKCVPFRVWLENEKHTHIQSAAPPWQALLRATSTDKHSLTTCHLHSCYQPTHQRTQVT